MQVRGRKQVEVINWAEKQYSMEKTEEGLNRRAWKEIYSNKRNEVKQYRLKL